ncbi:saxitoxin and tetrodotoxin-binding protein 2-like isoform X2 [Epinephelus fuscoguttatus]|uniref:saxitoxin and tetrodotoxin-binding protein 2-like isoform X2 n=1 Tax=Epinephelus fuscoguttatus TaxID=293821 RepID=UPI0020D15542|nr:saxitoxin and tetrodotoxin-binding protein 2-like isoform X2 [Epinephelus fuscoguttatus]
MSVVKQGTLLLLLLAVIGTSADHDDCHGLNTTLPATDLHKIVGDWVLVWSVSDHQQGWDLLPNVTSSHAEFRLLPDNHTYMFNERNMYIDKLCANYIINMSTEGSDDHMLHNRGARRDGHHRDVEVLNAAHDNHKKQAECLGFPHDKPFSYDGVADFCHKKSSADVEADHHNKAEKAEPTVEAAES